MCHWCLGRLLYGCSTFQSKFCVVILYRMSPRRKHTSHAQLDLAGASVSGNDYFRPAADRFDRVKSDDRAGTQQHQLDATATISNHTPYRCKCTKSSSSLQKITPSRTYRSHACEISNCDFFFSYIRRQTICLSVSLEIIKKMSKYWSNHAVQYRNTRFMPNCMRIT